MVVIVVIVLFYAATGGELLLLGATLSFSSLYAGWPVDCSCKRVLGTAVLAVCKHQAIKKKTKRRQSQLFLNYVSNLNCRRALSTHTHSVTVAQIQMCNNAANVTVISVLRCVAAHVKWPPISCGCWCRRIIIGLSNGLFAVNLRCCQMISRDCTEMRWMEMIYY